MAKKKATSRAGKKSPAAKTKGARKTKPRTNLANRLSLHRIARTKDIAAFHEAIEAGADVNEQDAFDATALHYSISEENHDIAYLLLEHGADVTIQDDKGGTALHYAVEYDAIDVAKAILQHDKDVLSIPDSYGNHPLWTAVFKARGNPEFVKLLLRYGAEVTHKNNVATSPLDLAQEVGDTAVIEVLEKPLREKTGKGVTTMAKKKDAASRNVKKSPMAKTKKTPKKTVRTKAMKELKKKAVRKRAINQFEDRLNNAFVRGCDDGTDSLSAADLARYRAWRFIMDWEMGGLTGYLYNTLPDLAAARSTVKALKTVGLTDLADILAQGVALFKGYKDPDRPSTWGEILEQYDPTGQLDILDERIQELDNFGIESAEAKLAKTRAKASSKTKKKGAAKKADGQKTQAKKAPARKTPAKKSSGAPQADVTQPSTVPAAWRRIELWLNVNAPPRAKSLAKGATAAQLQKLESQIAAELPEEFKQSYLIHNGQSNDLGLIPDRALGQHLLQVKGIVSEWKYCEDMDDSGDFDDISIRADKGVARQWWNPGWIPFASDGCGGFLCIDLAPTKSGQTGQVIRMPEDDPERERLAPSFGAWLEQLADALERGELKILY